jgi:hypothetical protein
VNRTRAVASCSLPLPILVGILRGGVDCIRGGLHETDVRGAALGNIHGLKRSLHPARPDSTEGVPENQGRFNFAERQE